MYFVNLIVYREEVKTKLSFYSIIISNSQIETLVKYSRSTNININMPFPNSNFEGIYSIYVFGKSFWNYRDLKIYCWASRHILGKKYIKYFRMCGGVNCCNKLKCIWRSYFTEAITTNMQIGNHFLVFKYPANCKQNISLSSIFLLKLM